jgi:hypothetical protein
MLQRMQGTAASRSIRGAVFASVRDKVHRSSVALDVVVADCATLEREARFRWTEISIADERSLNDDAGRIEGVRYEELTPMLLNEVQQQQRTIASQEGRLREMEQQQRTIARKEGRLREMEGELAELQEFRRSMQGRAKSE